MYGGMFDEIGKASCECVRFESTLWRIVYKRFFAFTNKRQDERSIQLISIDAIVRQCTDLLKAGLQPFIEREMKRVYNKDWESRSGCQIVDGSPHWDLQALLKTMLLNWQPVFESCLPVLARSLVFDLKDWRNRVAHEHAITSKDASRMVDTGARLLKAIGAPQTSELERLHLTVVQLQVEKTGEMRCSAGTSRAKQSPAPGGNPTAADVRNHVISVYLVPARERGDRTFQITARAIHDALNMRNAFPTVCTVVDSVKLHDIAGIRLIERSGPEKSSTVSWSFEIL